MVEYLIIFIYYLFMCSVAFYFLKNKHYYLRVRGKVSSSRGKKIINKFVNKMNSISYKIGGTLINKKFIRVKRKNIELLKLLQIESNINLTPESLTGYRVILFCLLFIAGFFAGSSPVSSSAMAVFAAVWGYSIPDIMLFRFNHRRKREMERELPDIIDLLIAATFSGQNIYNAIKIVTSKYGGRICSELSNFIKDIDVGTGKLQAYRNLIERSSSSQFKNFVFLLIQSEKYGASVNDLLKRKSDYIKFKSYQNLERKIRKTSVLILFPLVFLIMPSFIILVGGPLMSLIGGGLLKF